jgi:hypothetical protein
MKKKKYKKPEVRCTEIDCEIIMQGQSDEMDPEGVIAPLPFLNPLKWFK